ncbi:hypothetical protein [Microbacterium sp. 179-I 3D4 NHS]|uniref:hypothetical protein n=1 Tax=Microbacterium sp. 179-I 3D4 NHS TaxID=3142381 RepID=UPI0039A0DE15
MTSPRPLVTALSVLAAALLFTGCTVGPGPTSPQATSNPSSGPGDGSADLDGDMEGALLDDGRMFAIVTFGSSTCVPQVDTVTADGQTVDVTLVDVEGDQACTADMAPRATVGALPEGVDPSQDITLQVVYGDFIDDIDLTGGSFAGVPGQQTEYLPSAGWYDDRGLVLLTWGSSGCPPVIESIEGEGSAGTVTFETDDEKVCTLDMAPRATVIDFDGEVSDDEEFVLTLVGGGLDGTVTVPAQN